MSEKENNQQNEEVLTVGLGASAGGLEAFKAFFNSLPDETGMAFIVVLHLAPGKESSLAEILQSQTALDVQQVSGETPIEADHVYIIPPDKMLTVED
jgi:two-component system CheB/CheR fusion protein